MHSETVRRVLDSRVEWLDAVQGLGEDLALALGLDEDERFAVAMALREGVNNAVEHGNRHDPTKRIEVQFLLHPDGLEIRIRDEGTGFDAGSLPDPLLPQNLLSSSGRGVFLMRNYMDELDLSRTSCRGGEIRMFKRHSGGSDQVRRDGEEKQTTKNGIAVGGSARHARSGMSMKMETQQIGTVTVVRVKGKITIGEGDVKLREAIEALINQDHKHVLVDLGNVSFMDSSGVGELVGCYTTVMNRGGKLKLLNLTKKIHDLLQVTQLITVFDTYTDEAKALQSFAG